MNPNDFDDVLTFPIAADWLPWHLVHTFILYFSCITIIISLVPNTCNTNDIPINPSCNFPLVLICKCFYANMQTLNLLNCCHARIRIRVSRDRYEVAFMCHVNITTLSKQKLTKKRCMMQWRFQACDEFLPTLTLWYFFMQVFHIRFTRQTPLTAQTVINKLLQMDE